jgi:protein-tyrosine-phosphatase
MLQPTRVLFLCTGNSARSQMAEGLLRVLGKNAFEAFSAGLDPKGVNPLAVTAMAEIGIVISMQRSKHVEEYTYQLFDFIISVCDNAREHCQCFPVVLVICIGATLIQQASKVPLRRSFEHFVQYAMLYAIKLKSGLPIDIKFSC